MKVVVAERIDVYSIYLDTQSDEVLDILKEVLKQRL